MNADRKQANYQIFLETGVRKKGSAQAAACSLFLVFRLALDRSAFICEFCVQLLPLCLLPRWPSFFLDHFRQHLDQSGDCLTLDLIAGTIHHQSRRNVHDGLDNLETVLGQGASGRNQIDNSV